MKRLSIIACLALTLGAQVTDQSALRFANETIRPAADMLAREYYTCKQVVSQWNAGAPVMSTLFPNTSAVVSDGSPLDGRRAITGAMVNLIVTRCQERITDMEQTSSARLNSVLGVAVNPTP
jgi:hypothetical protein